MISLWFQQRGSCSEQVPHARFDFHLKSSAFLRFSPQVSALPFTLPLHLPSRFFNHLPLAGAFKLPPPPFLAAQLTTAAKGSQGPPQAGLLRQLSTLSHQLTLYTLPFFLQTWHWPQLSAKLIRQTSPCQKCHGDSSALSAWLTLLETLLPTRASLPQTPSLQRLWSFTSGGSFCFLCPAL